MLVSTLPMLQAVSITPILAIVRNSYGEQPSATFLLRVIVAAPALTSYRRKLVTAGIGKAAYRGGA